MQDVKNREIGMRGMRGNSLYCMFNFFYKSVAAPKKVV